MVQTVMNIAALFQNIKIPENAHPVKVSLPPPPELSGTLTPNNWLTKAELLGSILDGPASTVHTHLGYVYTGLANGWIAKIRPNGHVEGLQRLPRQTCSTSTGPALCGRPLGVRLDPRGSLVIADSDSGIYMMNRWSGRFRQLVDSRRLMIHGKRVGFVNDLAVQRNGLVFFTSSSSRWRYPDRFNIILEGENTGRLMAFQPWERGYNRVVQVLPQYSGHGLSYPSGVELALDESYLLIGEAGRARILRLWLNRMPPGRKRVEVFADNLPGFVANIRRSPRGTYWVGLSHVRHSARPSVLDTHGHLPHLRKDMMGIPKDAMEPHYGLALELDARGKVVRSLHDANGTLFRSVRQVEETARGRLYIASTHTDFLGVLSLNSLPRPGSQRVAVNQPQQSPHSHSRLVLPSDDGNPALGKMLRDTESQTVDMSLKDLRQMVLVLMKQLMETRSAVHKTQTQVIKISSDVGQLRKMIGVRGGAKDAGTSSSSPGPDLTTSSGSGSSGSGSGFERDAVVRDGVSTTVAGILGPVDRVAAPTAELTTQAAITQGTGRGVTTAPPGDQKRMHSLKDDLKSLGFDLNCLSGPMCGLI